MFQFPLSLEDGHQDFCSRGTPDILFPSLRSIKLGAEYTSWLELALDVAEVNGSFGGDNHQEMSP